jgi:hypothetical protein
VGGLWDPVEMLAWWELPAAAMNLSTTTIDPTEVIDFPLDELVRLQLKIARRADELAQLQEHDVACGYWETAERELLPDALRLSA